MLSETRFSRLNLLLVVFILIGCDTNTGNDSTKDKEVPRKAVIDIEELFTLEEEKRIESQISDALTNSRIAVVVITTSSYKPFDNIQDYAVGKSNELGVGDATNNGALIVVSKSNGAIWISLGKGLENQITNNECQIIINESIIPEFRNSSYVSGVISGIQELENHMKATS